MFFSTLAKILVAPIILLLSIAGYHFAGPSNMVGSTIPIQPAFFETSLASGMSTADTSLTLASGTDVSGRSLSGYTCVVLNAGNTNAEVTCGTASGTSITGLTRGIDPLTGTSSVAALIFSHRRGEDVKITDYPNNTIYGRIFSGIDTLPSPLQYAAHPCSVSSASGTVCDKFYIDNQIVAGGVAGNSTTAGIYLLSTALQAASSTATGLYNSVTYNKALWSQYATDTPQYCITSSPCIPMTAPSGTLKPAWIDLTGSYAWTGAHTFTSLIATNATTTSATTTLIAINGVPYRFPSSQGASSTIWKNDGAGGITNEPESVYVLSLSGATSTTSSAASTTLSTITIPANTLKTTSSIKIHANTTNDAGGATGAATFINFGNGVSTSTIAWSIVHNIGVNSLDATIIPQSTITQSSTGVAYTEHQSTNFVDVPTILFMGTTTNFDTTGKLYISFNARTPSGSGNVGFLGTLVQVLTQP